MLNETFTTYIQFANKSTHKEDPILGSQIESTITRLCDGPAALMGMIHEVRIVDSFDRICIQIIGRDIVFPKELAEKQKSFRAATPVQKAQTVKKAIEFWDADNMKTKNLWI